MPGGHIDNGETPEQTALRETLEETGLTTTNARFLGFTNDIFFDEPGKHYITLWIVTDWTKGEPQASREMSDFIWAPLNNLPQPLFLPLQNLKKSPYWQKIQHI